jgi:hypothetical protein
MTTARRPSSPRNPETRSPARPDTDLLDQLPVLGDLMAKLTTRLSRQVYNAFGIELLYRPRAEAATIHAAITPAPRPHRHHPPMRQPAPVLAATRSDLEQHPEPSQSSVNMGFPLASMAAACGAGRFGVRKVGGGCSSHPHDRGGFRPARVVF